MGNKRAYGKGSAYMLRVYMDIFGSMESRYHKWENLLWGQIYTVRGFTFYEMLCTII